LEKGDFKLRVRAMEAERQLERSRLVEKNIFSTTLAALFMQGGVTLATVGRGLALSTPLSYAMFAASVAVVLRIPYGIMQLKKLDAYNERFGVKK
jgi:hypothetical protein